MGRVPPTCCGGRRGRCAAFGQMAPPRCRRLAAEGGAGRRNSDRMGRRGRVVRLWGGAQRQRSDKSGGRGGGASALARPASGVRTNGTLGAGAVARAAARFDGTRTNRLSATEAVRGRRLPFGCIRTNRVGAAGMWLTPSRRRAARSDKPRSGSIPEGRTRSWKRTRRGVASHLGRRQPRSGMGLSRRWVASEIGRRCMASSTPAWPSEERNRNISLDKARIRNGNCDVQGARSGGAFSASSLDSVRL
jgi:hypothetical protein